MFAHREVRLGVGAAVTDRHDGVSAAPYASLNLADHVGDDPAAVAANRENVRTSLGLDRLVTMQQVHGADVAVVDEPTAQPPMADALVTSTRGIGLVVLVADCTPLLMWDRRAGVVAAAHVGRRGLAGGVVAATVDAMRALHARPDRIYAVVGPGICPEHYEVPAAMRDEVAAAAPESAATTSGGTPALDIRSGLLAQLRDAGLQQWMVMPHCTAETSRYYSYRRDGVTGRFGGVVWREQ